AEDGIRIFRVTGVQTCALPILEFNTDGLIQELPWWYEGTPVEQLGTIDPYKRIEAETIAWSEGLKTDTDGNAGMYVTDIQDGDRSEERRVGREGRREVIGYPEQ